MTSLVGRLLRNASLTVLLQAWFALLSLAVTPLLYTSLGGESYGLFAIANVVISQLTVLEFGFGHATTRFLAVAVGRKDLAEARRVSATSLAVFAFAGCAGTLALLAGSRLLIERYFHVSEALTPTGRRVLALSALLFLLSMLTNYFAALWRGVQRFGTLNLARGFTGTAQSLGALAVVALGGGVEEVVAWSVCAGLAGLLAHGLLLARLEPALVPRVRPSPATFRSMAGFGGLLMLAGILTQLYVNGGALTMARFVAVAALPYYAIPLSLFQRLLAIASAIAAALLPMVAGLAESEAGTLLAELPGRGLRLLLLAMLPVAVVGSLLAHPLLALWMGSTFADQAAWPLQCCLVAFLLATSAVPWTELARGRGRAWPLVRYTAVLAIANIGLVVLLAPRWGVAGAATALVVGQIIGTLSLVASSGFALRALRTAGPLLAVGAGYALATLGASGLSATLAGRFAAALLLSLAYAYAAWRLGLDERERQVLRRAVARPSP